MSEKQTNKPNDAKSEAVASGGFELNKIIRFLVILVRVLGRRYALRVARSRKMSRF